MLGGAFLFDAIAFLLDFVQVLVFETLPVYFVS